MKTSDRLWLSSGITIVLATASSATHHPPATLVGATLGSVVWTFCTFLLNLRKKG